MTSPEKMFEFEYLKDHNILIGRFKVNELTNSEDAKVVYDYAADELKNQPDADSFIMDISSLKNVSSYAIGTLMKALDIMKKTKGYMILIMDESLLQEVMLQHPVMFDYYAVFHNLEDAIAFIKK